MRNWQRDLRRASFRGVRFWVEASDRAGGKRVARHEYAGGRRTYLEEMGLATAYYDVTAYLLGDASDREALSLETACLAAGPGRLQLPIERGFIATIENFRRLQERDRQGYIAFGFSAIPHSNESGSVLGIGDVTNAFLGGLMLAIPGFARLF